MKKGFTDIFEMDSVVKILALCVLTLGAYLIYKLYLFSLQINNNTNFKIPKFFIAITIVLYVISLGSLIYIDNLNILKSSINIHIISSVFDVTWIIMVRNRINLIIGSRKEDKLWLNPFVTSIFHVIYIQHKINQGLVNTDKLQVTQMDVKHLAFSPYC